MCTACTFYEFILKKKLTDLPEGKKEQFLESKCDFCPMK